MKKYLVLLALLTVSCATKEKELSISIATEKQAMSEIEEDTVKVANVQSYEQSRDSLLQLLLAKKANEQLKASMLREFYIRGLVNQVGDSLSFYLPFDLHGLDCGAPDCYSTDIRFKIKMNTPMEFPKDLVFSLVEAGCVDQEVSTSGQFELVEHRSELVNYYCKELKSNLVIKRNGNLYYFPHEKDKSISAAYIDKKFENYEFEDEALVPYQSTTMTTQFQNFESFLNNK